MLKLFAFKGKMGEKFLDNKFIPYSELFFFPNKVVGNNQGQDLVTTFKSKSIKKPQSSISIDRKYRSINDDFLGLNRIEKLLSLEIKKLSLRSLPKGKGTMGVMKRWGYKGQSASHGHSKSHRSVGSLSSIKGRIWKGRKMAGQKPKNLVYVKNLKILELSENSIKVIGSIPGMKGNIVELFFEI